MLLRVAQWCYLPWISQLLSLSRQSESWSMTLVPDLSPPWFGTDPRTGLHCKLRYCTIRTPQVTRILKHSCELVWLGESTFEQCFRYLLWHLLKQSKIFLSDQNWSTIEELTTEKSPTVLSLLNRFYFSPTPARQWGAVRPLSTTSACLKGLSRHHPWLHNFWERIFHSAHCGLSFQSAG